MRMVALLTYAYSGRPERVVNDDDDAAPRSFLVIAFVGGFLVNRKPSSVLCMQLPDYIVLPAIKIMDGSRQRQKVVKYPVHLTCRVHQFNLIPGSASSLKSK
jgi:hypothetical protein